MFLLLNRMAKLGAHVLSFVITYRSNGLQKLFEFMAAANTTRVCHNLMHLLNCLDSR